ncbi:hypothetical protein APSETT444_007010 [Aspergillus pseudonomiae]
MGMGDMGEGKRADGGDPASAATTTDEDARQPASRILSMAWSDEVGDHQDKSAGGRAAGSVYEVEEGSGEEWDFDGRIPMKQRYNRGSAAAVSSKA